MMNLKNKSVTDGFTIVETLLSIALIAVSIGVVVDLQTTSARSIYQTVHRLDRTLTAYDFFVQHIDGQDDTARATETDPEMSITYERIPVPQNSVLAKDFQHMHIEKASWQWQDAYGTQQDELAMLHYIQPEPTDTHTKEASPEKAEPKKTAQQQAVAPKKPAVNTNKNVAPKGT